MKITARHITFLIFFFVIIVAFSIVAGTEWDSLFSIVSSIKNDHTQLEYDIIQYLRLPRIVLALVIGAGLGTSGAAFQSLLKNDLADPYIIGVSGGAAFGASIAVILFPFSIPIVLCSFSGALCAVTLVYFFTRRHQLGSVQLTLCGIALSFIFSSGVLLLFAFSKAEKIHKALLWLMGDLSIARYTLLPSLGMIIVILMGIIFVFYKHLNILSLGEQFSQTLGVHGRHTGFIYWIASLVAALTVTLGGVIGFVGLMIPHIVRKIYGQDYRHLLPLSATYGGIFLLLCDSAGRSIIPPYEIPCGIITGFIGGIFFLVMVVRRNRAI